MTTRQNKGGFQLFRLNRFRLDFKAKAVESKALLARLIVVGITMLAVVLSSHAQEPSVRFIDGDGKMLAEVQAFLQAGQIYLPVDTVKKVFDPAMTYQYNRPRKRLTLTIKGKQLRLQTGMQAVSIDAGKQTRTLSTPPIVVGQRPMLPIAFFTQILPHLDDVEVVYNSSLKWVRIMSKTTRAPAEDDAVQDWVVIVDPGHGGPDDRGCESSTGLFEKDVVFALAKQLQRVSRQQGIHVYLTREADVKKTHLERVQLANRIRPRNSSHSSPASHHQGQLFLSLHCNASFSPNEKGIRIYVNNPNGKLRFPRPANLAPTGKPVKILSQANFLKQSQEFAFMLQRELNSLTEAPVVITELPLAAVSQAYMPAVLLEIGYLSNVEDLEKLSNPEHVAELTKAIARAIQMYTTPLNQQDGTTAAGQ